MTRHRVVDMHHGTNTYQMVHGDLFTTSPGSLCCGVIVRKCLAVLYKRDRNFILRDSGCNMFRRGRNVLTSGRVGEKEHSLHV
jgi:hypothetical protein